MILRTYIPILALCIIAIGCKSSKLAQNNNNSFVGKIVYDIIVEGDSQNIEDIQRAKELYGNTLELSIFENGDILMNYNGSPKGYDLSYIDVNENELTEKFNSSDTLYVRPASKQNVKKLTDIRQNDKTIDVLNHECKAVSLSAEDQESKQYLTIKYWYSNDYKVDATRYSSINEDLMGYLFQKSNGGIFLRKEISYSGYSITFVAKEIKRITAEDLGDQHKYKTSTVILEE